MLSIENAQDVEELVKRVDLLGEQLVSAPPLWSDLRDISTSIENAIQNIDQLKGLANDDNAQRLGNAFGTLGDNLERRGLQIHGNQYTCELVESIRGVCR